MVFLSVSLFVWGLLGDAGEAARRVAHRLKVYTGRLAHSPWNPALKEEEGLPPWQRFLRRVGSALAPRSAAQRLEAELARAGIPMRGEEFITVQLGVTAGLPLLMLAATHNLAGAVVLGIFGYTLTRMVIIRGKAGRARKFNDQLVDSLAIMANSLRAGFSFFQAMDTVRREMPDPIAGEFSRALREINLGRSVDEALEGMARRVESPDLDLVVTAVLIQRQVGGNLAEILDIISETIRERIRIKGQIRTLTAQGRISGLVVGLLPVFFGALLLVISPDYLKVLFTEKAGLLMLAGAAVSELVGFLLIRQITNIEI
ncbi:tight adherence protein B [Desulfofundulus thermosubterraneus DSM 16057]|uniref:Tight adherence protein B n=1 Tax=Desulfofundulus thermosubterraneus DSM 16057 TaxID=1121432 RepID=A0A1M6D8G5_9FIRM|nr:tight adherence protein B [Desulfofundulus thermosubterraneus DSM 16057]